MKVRSVISILGAMALAPLIAGAASGPGARPSAPVVGCEQMAGREFPASSIGLPTKGFKVTTARLLPAVTPGPGPVAAGGQGPPAPDPSPAYCRIDGSILSVDASAPPINFAIAIPAAWNGSSWQLGGGGTNGSIPVLTSTGSGETPPGTPNLLTQGYAVYGGDSGHQGQGTDWVRNAESWNNFAYLQLKKTSDAAQTLLQTMYGHKATRRFFAGTSQGGREGLEVVTRYPADYDGVLVHVPLAYFQGLLIDPTIKVLDQVKPGAWIQPSKYPLLTNGVIAACDSLDGLSDGVISNYAACNRQLDPSQTATALSNLRCASGRDEGDACLSDAQLKMFNSLHGPVAYPYPIPNGQPNWPGWGPGADTALLSRTAPDPTNPNGPFGIGAGVQKQLFGASPDFNLYNFDLLKYRARIEGLSRELDVPADFSAFLKKGGKLVWVTAGADTISNPRAQMRLYDEVVKKNGRPAVDAGVRYYVVPMADHGLNSRSATGEAMPSSWNPVGALRDWVEQGITPSDTPILAAYANGAVTATRPICRYPAYPAYIGGDKARDSAYACRKS